MGEPKRGNLSYPLIGRTHGELKYLSSHGKEIKRDSLSSDERNGNSPNHKMRVGSFCTYGVVGIVFGEANKPNIVYYC